MKEIYCKNTRFHYDIRDLFYLARNLDKLREYAGDAKWRTERLDMDSILDYHGDDLLSKTTIIEDNPPTFMRATVIITGLEQFPFDLEVTLEEKGKNQTVVEYKIHADLGEEFDQEVIWSTIDEFRKALYTEFAKACHNLELERRRQETAHPFIDLDK